MKVKRVKLEDNAPFVTITLTRKEAQILKELCRYDINKIMNSCGHTYIFDKDANDVFGYPMYHKLEDLGV